jgi:hypothetical protein
MDLYGRKNLGEYDVDVHRVAMDSYRNFKINGNRFVSVTESARSGVMGLDSLVYGNLSGIALPTCVCSDCFFAEYDNPVRLMNNHHQQFPCSCGEFSTGTRAFMHGLGWAPEDNLFKSGAIWAEMQQICPQVCS